MVKMKVKCTNCGMEFLRYKSRSKGIKNHFCNRNCQNLFRIRERQKIDWKARFMSKVDVISDSIWIWKASKISKTYGVFGYKGKSVCAHRASYEIFIGSIPKGLCVCHRDDNPSNVAPNNLWVGTLSQNARDSRIKGRDYACRRKITRKTKQKHIDRISRLINNTFSLKETAILNIEKNAIEANILLEINEEKDFIELKNLLNIIKSNSEILLEIILKKEKELNLLSKQKSKQRNSLNENKEQLYSKTKCVMCGQKTEGMKFDETDEPVCSLDCLDELKKSYLFNS